MSALRIGTRGSDLAMAQARQVRAMLLEVGAKEVEICEIHTRGDIQKDHSLAEIGGVGAFTKEIEEALLRRDADVAVHSLKDLPTALSPGLVLAAVPLREDTRDALISRHGGGLERLPQGARVATSSLRRICQIRHVRPDVVCVEVRGNVPTRLQKLKDGQFDALVLALAGLRRLGLEEHATHVFSPAEMLPAVGQGALGLETRAEDAATLALVTRLEHGPTRCAVDAERALLASLGAGCRLPLGGWARMEEEALVLDGVTCSLDGSKALRAQDRDTPGAAHPLGLRVAEQLRRLGAEELLREARAT